MHPTRVMSPSHATHSSPDTLRRSPFTSHPHPVLYPARPKPPDPHIRSSLPTLRIRCYYMMGPSRTFRIPTPSDFLLQCRNVFDPYNSAPSVSEVGVPPHDFLVPIRHLGNPPLPQATPYDDFGCPLLPPQYLVISFHCRPATTHVT